MDKKINFLHTCREAAAEAEKLFGMNARIILAQGALESGWGTSMLATEHHNFFGLMGYGASNAYWHGQRATFEPAYGTFVIELAAGEDAQSVVTRLEDAGLDANVDVVELGQVTSAYELTCDGQVADLAVQLHKL